MITASEYRLTEAARERRERAPVLDPRGVMGRRRRLDLLRWLYSEGWMPEHLVHDLVVGKGNRRHGYWRKLVGQLEGQELIRAWGRGAQEDPTRPGKRRRRRTDPVMLSLTRYGADRLNELIEFPTEPQFLTRMPDRSTHRHREALLHLRKAFESVQTPWLSERETRAWWADVESTAKGDRKALVTRLPDAVMASYPNSSPDAWVLGFEAELSYKSAAERRLILLSLVNQQPAKFDAVLFVCGSRGILDGYRRAVDQVVRAAARGSSSWGRGYVDHSVSRGAVRSNLGFRWHASDARRFLFAELGAVLQADRVYHTPELVTWWDGDVWETATLLEAVTAVRYPDDKRPASIAPWDWASPAPWWFMDDDQLQGWEF